MCRPPSFLLIPVAPYFIFMDVSLINLKKIQIKFSFNSTIIIPCYFKIFFFTTYICWVSLCSSSCWSRRLITCSSTTLHLWDYVMQDRRECTVNRKKNVDLFCTFNDTTGVLCHLLFSLRGRGQRGGCVATACRGVDQLMWVSVGQHAWFLMEEKQEINVS